uniref:C-type lectin domain-containing protein n=1 Tax=Gallus gallus TaxID=9031 RepID=A0A8V0XE51_CHICK
MPQVWVQSRDLGFPAHGCAPQAQPCSHVLWGSHSVPYTTLCSTFPTSATLPGAAARHSAAHPPPLLEGGERNADVLPFAPHLSNSSFQRVGGSLCHISQFVHVCPNAWVGFQGKCYYLSKEENDWNSSREHCNAHGASLATIGSAEEMDFMMRFQGLANCRIGLHREEEDAQWMWSDGTAFTNWSVCLSSCHDFPRALFEMGIFSWCHSRGFA